MGGGGGRGSALFPDRLEKGKKKKDKKKKRK